MPIPYALHLPLSSLLLALATALVLELLARRFPEESLARGLLLRSRLSLSLTLLLAGVSWWLLDRLGAAGWALPRSGLEIRGAVLSLGLLWTLLRCKDTLIRRMRNDPRWLPKRTASNRLFLLDLADKLLTALVVLLGGLEVLRLLGVSPAVLLTASGIGAAAVGFGARSLVENLLGGMMLYINRPFVIGDQIELPDRKLAGSVETIGAYHSELITIEGERLYVPNALFANFAIANRSRRSFRHLLLEIGLDPLEPARLEELVGELRHTLLAHPLVLADRPRRVHLGGFVEGQTTLRAECFLRGEQEDLLDLRHQLILRVNAALACPAEPASPG